MVILTDVVIRVDKSKYCMKETENIEEASETLRESLGAHTEVHCEKIYKN